MSLNNPTYVFAVEKSAESTAEQFLSAISCARDSVESILGGELVNVTVEKEAIIVEPQGQNRSIDMTLVDCREKIKGSFCDSSGVLYPEFAKVISTEKST